MYEFLLGKMKRYLLVCSLDGSMVLKVLLNKWYEKLWTGFTWLRIYASEYGNKPEGCTK